MKFSRAGDYNQTNLDADESRSSYVAGDYPKLGKIALACIRNMEIMKWDQSVIVGNSTILQAYHDDIFTKHPCLVLKTDRVYYYTRNNVCKMIRGRGVHTHVLDPLSPNQKKKMKVLDEFIDEKPVNVLFCVMSQWIKTPFLQFHGDSYDSRFSMKESYTNDSGKKSEIGIIESVIFNIQDEIGHIFNDGKVGWSFNKIIFPFLDSYKNDFGVDLFYKIKKTLPWLIQMNKNVKYESHSTAQN